MKNSLTKAEYNLLKALESIMPEQKQNGSFLNSAASFGLGLLPGGQLLTPFLPDLGKMFSKKQSTFAPTKMNTNPFGNIMKDGGVLNEGFKQYDTGSHIEGNDLAVNSEGVPSNNPVAKVQNKENMFKVKGKAFIMSDVLVNPETGNTINVDAAKLNKSLPMASFNPEDKNTLNFGMERLSKLNDIMKGIKEGVEMECGGTLKRYDNGGPIAGFVPRRVDPFTGREYNLIEDAPSIDPLSEPLAPLPQVQAGASNNREPQFSSFKVDDSPYIPSIERQDNEDITPFDGITGETNQPVENKPFDLNTIAVGLKGLGLAKSISDSLTPALEEQVILPDYTQSDRYMKEANIDYTQARQNAIGASNVGANVNRSASSNFAQYQNREMARTANLVDAIANIDMQENNARSSLNLTRGQYEQNKAVDTANRKYQNRIDNLQNQATANLADQKLFTELSQIGTEFNKAENFRRQISNNRELQQFYVNEALSLINSRNDNFQLDPDFVNKLKSGNYSIDDIIKVVNITGLNTNQ